MSLVWPEHDAALAKAGTSVPNRSGVLIAIVDTGLDIVHDGRGWRPRHSLLAQCAAYRFGGNYVEPGEPPIDREGHGTGVTGLIVGALTQGFFGPPNRQASLLVLRAGGSGSQRGARLAAAVHEALGAARSLNKRLVINLSWGGAPSSEMEAAVAAAAAQEAVFVTIAHNDDRSEVRSPGNLSPAYQNLICVGALDCTGGRLKHSPGRGSNEGEALTLTARGEHCVTIGLQGTLIRVSGTSAAAPWVTATSALMLGADPLLPAASLRRYLEATARHPSLRAGLRDASFGYGALNAEVAVAAVLSSRSTR